MVGEWLRVLTRGPVEKMRAVKKVTERFLGEQCAEKSVSERLVWDQSVV